MSAPSTKLIFPQLVLRNQRTNLAGPRFHGVLLPDGPAARETFYRGLPCVGWIARETARIRPDADSDKVLRFSLATLREHVTSLARIAPGEYEAEILRVLQARLKSVYGELQWPKPAAPVAETDKEPAGRARKLVLVVEDEPVTRYHLCSQLRACGFDTHGTECGAEALLMASLLRPDLLLMDLHMDGVDGRQACALLKQSRFAGNPPVIFISGETEEEIIKRALEAGGADFLRKPFNRDAALPRIAAALGETDPEPPAGKTPPSPKAGAGDRDFSKMSSTVPPEGRHEPGVGLRRATVDLAPMLNLVLWIMTPIAKKRKIRLELDAPESGLVVTGDELRLQCVLESLIAKAIKAAAEGCTLTLGALTVGSLVNLTIETMHGNGATNVEKVTNSEASTRDAGSPHPSLDVCRKILAAHGGAIHTTAGAAEAADYFISLPAFNRFPRNAPANAEDLGAMVAVELAAAG